MKETKNTSNVAGGKTNTEKENFNENKDSNENDKGPKIKQVNHNQTLQKDSVEQHMISIPIDNQMAGWLSRIKQQIQVV